MFSVSLIFAQLLNFHLFFKKIDHFFIFQIKQKLFKRLEKKASPENAIAVIVITFQARFYLGAEIWANCLVDAV